MIHTSRIGRALAVAGLAVLLIGVVPATTASAATDKLPDLGMAQLKDIATQTVGDEQRLLFSTVIVNVGDGPFELEGRRGPSDELMSSRQRIFDDEGDSRVEETGATMHFSGDGHDHWHVRDLATYKLTRISDGVDTDYGLKSGYCFFDNYEYRLDLPGAPSSPVYRGCGRQAALTVTMGLSVGWGDLYDYRLPDQYIDITGLEAGNYRIQAAADAKGWFSEKSNSNNSTWADIELRADGTARVLALGPGTAPIEGGGDTTTSTSTTSTTSTTTTTTVPPSTTTTTTTAPTTTTPPTTTPPSTGEPGQPPSYRDYLSRIAELWRSERFNRLLLTSASDYFRSQLRPG